MAGAFHRAGHGWILSPSKSQRGFSDEITISYGRICTEQVAPRAPGRRDIERVQTVSACLGSLGCLRFFGFPNELLVQNSCVHLRSLSHVHIANDDVGEGPHWFRVMHFLVHELLGSPEVVIFAIVFLAES